MCDEAWPHGLRRPVCVFAGALQSAFWYLQLYWVLTLIPWNQGGYPVPVLRMMCRWAFRTATCSRPWGKVYLPPAPALALLRRGLQQSQRRARHGLFRAMLRSRMLLRAALPPPAGAACLHGHGWMEGCRWMLERCCRPLSPGVCGAASMSATELDCRVRTVHPACADGGEKGASFGLVPRGAAVWRCESAAARRPQVCGIAGHALQRLPASPPLRLA